MLRLVFTILAPNATNLLGRHARRMHPAYTLCRSEPKIRDQKIEINSELARSFNPAARRWMTKPLDTLLQFVQ